MKKAKLYNWYGFNTQGNLRTFSSGFNIKKARELMFKDIQDGLIVVQVDSLGIIPEFIEGFYYKTSVNNDLQTLLNKLNEKI